MDSKQGFDIFDIKLCFGEIKSLFWWKPISLAIF